MRQTLNAPAFGLRPSAGKAGLLRVIFAAVLLAPACDNPNYTHLYATQPIAPSYTAADVAALNHMGATLTDDGVNFATYSENATKLQVALFDNPTDQLPAQQFDMTPQGNVWNVFVSGIGLHQAYGYIAWGPNWPHDPNWHPGSIDGFIADVDSFGNRFDPNKLLLDPWAQMVTGPFNWAEASAASGPDRTASTYQAAGKALTVDSQYAWSSNEATWITARQNPNMPGHRWQDQIVYEMHPKGFTASPASGVDYPGTFHGIGERASYFADLGVTAVELMPSLFKSTDGGYWGYDTIGFFIPELTYSSINNPDDPEGPIDEFKWMVDQLHQNGIEVYLDVVYNHTGEGGLWQDEIQYDDVPPLPDGDPQLTAFDAKEVASIFEWRGLDNQAYYALSTDNQTYWDNSGVGQDTRCNHTPFTRLIMDSLHFWVSQMHVDGFRFDEAAVLGETDKNYNQWANPADTVLQTIADDPLFHLQNIRIVAEPWSGGGDFQGSYPASTTLPGYGWGEWSGPFRDWWRSFVDCDGTQPPCCNGVPGNCGAPTCTGPSCLCTAPNCNYDGNGNPIAWTLNTAIWTPNGSVDATAGFFLYGSQGLFQPNGRLPYHSYNFTNIHDGFTMYDLFSYDEKVNGCGPLNPGCCTDPSTPYCQTDDGVDNNLSRDWGHCTDSTQCAGSTCSNGQCASGDDGKRQMMRNLFVALMVSNGTPLLLGGDEWERTQLGNNNPYSSLADNADNWFDWGSWQADPDRVRMHDFVRQIIALRKQFSAALAPADWGSGPTVSWEDAVAQACPSGGNASDGLCTANWNSRHLAVHYPPSSTSAEVDILINMESSATNFTLPPGNWVALADTQSYFDDAVFTTNTALDPTQSDNIWLASPTPVPGGAYNVMPQSIVIVQGAPATSQ
jgi:glycogen operon protein